jgi:Na+-translocating ferredoxin:NAD+ oxidoreductase RnfA subunit
MTAHTPVQDLLGRELTRKQFLKVVGYGIVAALGFSTIMHFLTGKRPSAHIASISPPPVTKYGHKP